MSRDTNEEVYKILQSQGELQKINGEDLKKKQYHLYLIKKRKKNQHTKGKYQNI